MAAADELLDALDSIDPTGLGYQEWCDVGMALQREGYGPEVWDAWSARDPKRYHPGECERKWSGFGERDEPVTAKTVFKMAYDAGWKPGRDGSSFGWDDEVEVPGRPGASKAAPVIVTKSVVTADDVGEDELPDPSETPADPSSEIEAYLRAVFLPDEHVAYVTDEAANEDGKWRPVGSGYSDRTRDELVESLHRYPDPSMTFGTAKAEAGAWVRINPMDGEGAGDSHVIAYRHALVESDELAPGKQLALIRAMRLPVSAIVTSGGKSVHALVRVDARDIREYRERVRALYEHCARSGFKVDEQNRNPSRLSRLPGFRRGEGWQRLVQAGPGDAPATWEEWQDWVTDETSGLPQIESLSGIMEMPPLAPQLIHGVLRDGQKGMLIGPSKAGKSFALIELAVAVARGWEWMGHRCAQGRVLYVNMEIQGPSFINRVADVYRAMASERSDGLPGDDAALLRTLGDLDVWNLRGHSSPLTKLVPKMLRRAADRGYRLVIIDPIYKVLTGDENSASDMAEFTNQFDVIADSLGCAVFYAHHHAKGEAGRRGAIDRASGSGVFARDPDAMLDMSPIAVPDEMRDALRYEVAGSDGEAHERHGTAYRLSYTLREFETPLPRDVVFAWPRHVVTDAFRGCRVVGEFDPSEQSRRASRAKKEKSAERWEQVNDLVADAVGALEEEGMQPTVDNVDSWIRLNRAADANRLKVSKQMLQKSSTPSYRKDRNPAFGWVKEAPDGGGPYVLRRVFE